MYGTSTDADIDVSSDGLDDALEDVDWEATIDAFRDFLAHVALRQEHPVLTYVESELEVEEELLDAGLEKTVLIRQSTFLESFLSSAIQLTIEGNLEHEMYNEDLRYLEEGTGAKGKVRLAYWLGILEKDERDAFLELMGVRGTIAHSAWLELELAEENGETEYDYQRIAERIYDLLEAYAEES